MKLESAEQIIEYIKNAKKKTPVKVYLQGEVPLQNSEDIKVFGNGGEGSYIIFGELMEVKAYLDTHKSNIQYYHIENDRRNSAIPLANLMQYNARIEPGVTIRDQVEIGDNAVIMMGSVINIGVKIGQGTMIDMNVVLGGRVEVGNNCHIGAGTVLAGVIEPPSSKPVVIEDDVVIGANVAVLEGIRVGKGAVVAAGAVVTSDVEPNTVVAGIPARFIKMKDDKTSSKTQIIDALRKI